MTNECAICEKWPFDLQPGSMRAGADLRLRRLSEGFAEHLPHFARREDFKRRNS